MDTVGLTDKECAERRRQHPANFLRAVTELDSAIECLDLCDDDPTPAAMGKAWDDFLGTLEAMPEELRPTYPLGVS